jgi:hypothetical protein
MTQNKKYSKIIFFMTITIIVILFLSLKLLIYIISYAPKEGNTFYFDINEQSISSKNTVINNIEIESRNDYISVTLLDKRKNKVSIINFNIIDTAYFDVKDRIIDNKLNLLPNEKYIISNQTYRNATTYSINIYTDSIGKVYKIEENK